MKRASLLAAVLAMVLSLAACGTRDNGSVNSGGTGANGTSGTTAGTADGGMDSGTAGMTGGSGGTTSGTTGNTSGSGSTAGGTTGTAGGTGSTAGGMTGNTAGTRGSLVDDLEEGTRDVMRDVERGVDGLLEVSPQSGNGTGASTTSFQRMLNNARVHDVDGVLTDGENSRW